MDDLDSLLADLQSSVPQRNSSSFQQDSSNGVYQQADSHVQQADSHVQQADSHVQQADSHVQQTNGYQQQHNNARVISNGFSQPHTSQNPQTYVQESREEVRTETRSSGPTPQVKNDELDSLLSELNQAKYSAILDRASTGSNGGGGGGRAPVETYLNELNSVNSTSNRQQKFVTDVGHSTATRDLDDLMNDLSDFKINRNEPRNTGPNPALQDDLDSLLGELNQRKYTTVDGRVGSGGYTSRDHRQVASTNHVTNLEPTRTDYTVTKTEQVYAKPEKARSPSPELPPPPPPVKEPSPPLADELDCMLGSLKNHMTEQGVTTTQKGCCCACEKPIVGQVITALGKTWHPEHFTCTHCSSELGSKNFFERDGKPYCESCYHELFSPKCAYCDKSILDKCVTALDKTWHPEHFFCAQCGNTFGEEGFHEKDGKAYCREDYYNMFAPKCGGCNAPIMENYISALNAQWHPECFVCRDCRQPFSGGSFFDHEGMPYCETHYHSKRGSLCAGCHKPITGRCITAMFRKYHPEHFTCSYCMRQLNKGTFKEQNDKPYCHGCFEKLYG